MKISGSELRYWRQRQGLTQKLVGRFVGRCQQTISDYELGKDSIPDEVADVASVSLNIVPFVSKFKMFLDSAFGIKV